MSARNKIHSRARTNFQTTTPSAPSSSSSSKTIYYKIKYDVKNVEREKQPKSATAIRLITNPNSNSLNNSSLLSFSNETTNLDNLRASNKHDQVVEPSTNDLLNDGSQFNFSSYGSLLAYEFSNKKYLSSNLLTNSKNSLSSKRIAKAMPSSSNTSASNKAHDSNNGMHLSSGSSNSFASNTGLFILFFIKLIINRLFKILFIFSEKILELLNRFNQKY
jgi:hypothetical protein